MDYDLKALIATLNPACRQSLEDAASLCVERGHHTIEVEHFLLKLLERPNTDLQRVLLHFGVDNDAFRRDLVRAINDFRDGNTRVPQMSANLPRLFREAWLAASLHLGASRVRSAAILLALRTTEGLRDQIVKSAPVLRRMDVERLRLELPDLIRTTGEAASAAAPAGSRPPTPDLAPTNVVADTPALDQYTIDLTRRAREGAIDPIIGRDGEIRQVIDILTRRRQNNPILTGEAGVGKTAVVEGLARRIVAGDVPPALKYVSLRMLDLALLQAGAGVQGEFERRLRTVVAEVQSAVQPIILFIDEAHALIGAGGAAGQQDAANLLKPALARGELRTIAATTWSEYKRYFETDSALARRFQVVKVEEPDAETAIVMLRAQVPHLEKHHRVRILDEAVTDAVHLSRRYITGRRLPDKAVSVLDTACARVSLGQRSTPAAVEDAGRRVERLEAEVHQLEREQAAFGDHRQRLSELLVALEDARRAHAELESRWHAEQARVDRIRELEDSLENRRQDTDDARRQLIEERERLALLQAERPMVPLDVDGRVVAAVISGWTGIPVGKMLTDDVEAVLDLDRRLATRVIGQTRALDAIGRRIRTSRAGLEDPDKPVGVFLLVGPSGVGKTETATALADTLYGGAEHMVVVNMSEYQEAHSVANLKGAPPGYVGYGRGGVLTEAVRRRPYSVVLLDEVEKAHPDVLELFYQVFDKGRLEDGEGVPVDFRNTVILLTSNVGDELILQHAEQSRPDPQRLVEAIRPALLERFPPALLGRLVVVPYYPLERSELRRIVELKLGHVERRFRGRHRARLRFAPKVVDRIVARCVERHTGARTIDHFIGQTLLPAISAAVLERVAAGEPVTGFRVSAARGGEFRVTPTHDPDEDAADEPLDEADESPPPPPPPRETTSRAPALAVAVEAPASLPGTELIEHPARRGGFFGMFQGWFGRNR